MICFRQFLVYFYLLSVYRINWLRFLDNFCSRVNSFLLKPRGGLNFDEWSRWACYFLRRVPHVKIIRIKLTWLILKSTNELTFSFFSCPIEKLPRLVILVLLNIGKNFDFIPKWQIPIVSFFYDAFFKKRKFLVHWINF